MMYLLPSEAWRHLCTYFTSRVSLWKTGYRKYPCIRASMYIYSHNEEGWISLAPYIIHTSYTVFPFFRVSMQPCCQTIVHLYVDITVTSSGRIDPGTKKGLRDRNSPTCTLSQNGYGDSSISALLLALCQTSWTDAWWYTINGQWKCIAITREGWISTEDDPLTMSSAGVSTLLRKCTESLSLYSP